MPSFQQLSVNESWQGDYTHKAVITFSDFAGVAALTSAIVIETPGVGFVLQNAAAFVVTPFAGITGPVTVQLGQTGALTGLLPASTVSGAVTSFAYASVTQIVDNVASNQVIATVTSASGNLSGLTAGEVHLFWSQRALVELCYPQQ
jgi:hypothetical protein